jgi:hypothetical protein
MRNWKATKEKLQLAGIWSSRNHYVSGIPHMQANQCYDLERFQLLLPSTNHLQCQWCPCMSAWLKPRIRSWTSLAVFLATDTEWRKLAWTNHLRGIT